MFNQRERDLIEAAFRTFEAHRQNQGTGPDCPVCQYNPSEYTGLENHTQSVGDREHEKKEVENLLSKVAKDTNLYAK